jgi:hypothetical protein
MHAAGVESIAIITINNQVCIGTNWPWQSNKKPRIYIDTAINAFALSVLRKVAAIALLNTHHGLSWRPALAMLQPW